MLGNKRALILGAILQALGAFSMAIPTSTGLYTGLGLIILGGGLYNPNFMAQFGKLYLQKKRLLDAGFAGVYSLINAGAFLGILLIGLVGEKISWSAGFILAGILMVIALVLGFISSKTEETQTKAIEVSGKNGFLNIGLAFLAMGIFWFFYELAGSRSNDIKQILSSNESLNLGLGLWDQLYFAFALLIGILAVLLWSNYYFEQWVKIATGFLLGAVSFGIILLFPKNPTEQYFIPFIISILLLSMAEILITPSVHTMVIRYGNPKYLALIFSLFFIPIQVANTYASFPDDPIKAIGTVSGGMLLIALLLFLWIGIDKTISLDIEKIDEDI